MCIRLRPYPPVSPEARGPDHYHWPNSFQVAVARWVGEVVDVAAIVAFVGDEVVGDEVGSASLPSHWSTTGNSKAARWLDGQPCCIPPQSVNDHGRAVSDLLWMRLTVLNALQ